MIQLKIEQVVALAPDAGTLQRARKLATPRSFSTAGSDTRALWADVKGSGSPYQCFVDLRGPAYRCSCPVRKQPCKHVLARQFAAEQNRDSLLGGLTNGSLIDAQIHYYSTHTPLRALLIHDRSQVQPTADKEALQRLQASASPDLDTALRAARAAQCRNPFAHEIPLWIDELRLVIAGDRFALADRDGRLLPLAKDYAPLWQLLAYTGDRPATLFVIFDGQTARPWALAQQGRYRALDMNEGVHG